MKPTVIKTLSVLGLAAIMQSAAAGNITDINVSTLSNNQKIIKIKFDKDVVQPSGFITTTPARIALDFPGTGVQLVQPVLEYSDPLLNQITAAQNNDRARILLNLAKAGEYNTEIKGNEVWVYIDEAPERNTVVSNPAIQTETVAQAPTPRVDAAPKAAPNTAFANIDFRKSGRDAGIVELSTPGFEGNPVVNRQSGSITITLKNYPLPAQAQRNLDVTDFSTPVRTITMKRLGNDTQIQIKIQGGWDVNTQSSGSRTSFTISRKTDVASQGFQPQSNKSFKGRKVSLDFQDVDVRTILQILAKESGTNIVASDSVSGKMTLTLKDVPWDQALDLVMQARNLDMRRQGNIINIAPRDELLAKDKATLQAQNEINNLGPLFSQTFQLKYKNVEEFQKILRIEDSGSNSSSNSILSTRGSALIDPSTNTLIITDNTTVIQKFQKVGTYLPVRLWWKHALLKRKTVSRAILV